MSQFDTSVYSKYIKDVVPKYSERKLNLRAVAAEFVGMTFFVFIGCATAVGFSTPRISAYAQDSGDVAEEGADGAIVPNRTEILNKVQADLLNAITINSSFGVATALAFGVAIMVLAYSLGRISGAHFNPAVTFSLFLTGNCPLFQALANVAAQFAGSILAAGFVYGITPDASVSSLGANALSTGVGSGEALLGEVMMTAMLCFVVHLTACDKENNISPMAPLAIGFTVFLAHTVLLPLDGCSINPARSFGPALLSGNWGGFWIFVIGPLIGSVLGVAAYLFVALPWDKENAIESKSLLSPVNNTLDAPVSTIDNFATDAVSPVLKTVDAIV